VPKKAMAQIIIAPTTTSEANCAFKNGKAKYINRGNNIMDEMPKAHSNQTGNAVLLPENSINLRDNKRKKLELVVMVFSFVLSFIVMLIKIPPGDKLCKFFISIAPVVVFTFPWVSNLGFLDKSFHEGLHAIAALWYSPPNTKISARSNNVFIEAPLTKKVWLKIVLFPLWLPITIFMFILPFDWQIALLTGILLATLSCGDIVDAIIIFRQSGKLVVDNENGLFCYSLDEK
jgi:hypothetical protein